MDAERGRRWPSIVIGGLLGGAAGLAAAGRVKVRRARREARTPRGLAAFEQAPCHREALERQHRGA